MIGKSGIGEILEFQFPNFKIPKFIKSLKSINSREEIHSDT